MSEKQQLLDRIKLDIIDNDVCSDLGKTATNLVVGHGNIDADVVIIGEAPGEAEDLQGLPFVGKAGKILDGMLEDAEIERSDLYITNIVKYRPPENRDPSKEEKLEFRPYLARELQAISPKVIVTLGRHSLWEFIPDAMISQARGQLTKVKFEGDEYWLVPMYHPSSTVYNREYRAALAEDLRALPGMVADVTKN